MPLYPEPEFAHQLAPQEQNPLGISNIKALKPCQPSFSPTLTSGLTKICIFVPQTNHNTSSPLIILVVTNINLLGSLYLWLIKITVT